MSLEEQQHHKDKKEKKDDNNKQRISGIVIVWRLMYTMIAPIVLFTLLGKYLDNLLNKKFLFVLVSGAFGIALGMYFVYKQAYNIKEELYGGEDK